MASNVNYHANEDALEARKCDYNIHPLLLSRWSPREMTGEEMTDSELMSLFEAGRWAPSHYNIQPWRFIYAKRGTEEFNKFMDLLWPMTHQWAKNASVLVMVVSVRFFMFKGQKSEIPTHSYDAGSAWMSIAIEGSSRGWVIHGMGGIPPSDSNPGFDYDKAYDVLNIPKDTHCVEAMIAIGKRPPKDEQKMKENISQRRTVDTFVSKGSFVIRDNDKF